MNFCSDLTVLAHVNIEDSDQSPDPHVCSVQEGTKAMQMKQIAADGLLSLISAFYPCTSLRGTFWFAWKTSFIVFKLECSGFHSLPIAECCHAIFCLVYRQLLFYAVIL
ncbi:hypothetical protein GDO81_007203 [Engystomops pustulosus]|uniref:Uncharacterized protein n=1 Tax=Engystomops pustulosus TaxID=76066 RepID=A0AAV7C5F8_ENGPU|nr:hypothetical protein GDO81_007203 [Engystomops pustulosus]